MILASKAYQYGIDAIIVQDIGLATVLIKAFPDLPIHASTQMTIHNLEGVLELQNLGFKRAVLARELSLDEINYISKNSNIELEVFVHGALCISYSGQCLFSSMIGGRSGNRGKCAQPCRLPYELLEYKENSTLPIKLDNGYLLSPKDLCGLELLPELINSGISSLKIEGRMKNPEYVATVTKIYRKYLNLALDKTKPYIIEKSDKNDLLQVFNRGGLSSGHLLSKENKELIFKEKPNNMGIYIGKVKKHDLAKGLITCKLENSVNLGDAISFENENTKYTISELMEKNKNIKSASNSQIVQFGRMKGNINIGNKIYKISSKKLTSVALDSFSKDNIKINLNCSISIKKDAPIKISLSCPSFKTNISFNFDTIPEASKNIPLSKDKIINQFNKTQDTPFLFNTFEIDLDDNLFLPLSTLNEIRRMSILKLEDTIINSFKRTTKNVSFTKQDLPISQTEKTKISLLLNALNLELNYDNLENVDKLYIPLKYFQNNHYFELLRNLCIKFNMYIYLPSILRKSNFDSAKNAIKQSLLKFNIKGIAISNLSQIELIPSNDNQLDIVGNYTLNVYNSSSLDELKNLQINTSTLSPELDEEALLSVCNSSNNLKELIVYGNIPLMTMNYCPLGKTNKCYSECIKKCTLNSKFYIKDRIGVNFRIIPDNSCTISTIYNSKTTSIEYNKYNIDFARIDILDESIDEINNIINLVKNRKKTRRKKLYKWKFKKNYLILSYFNKFLIYITKSKYIFN